MVVIPPDEARVVMPANDAFAEVLKSPVMVVIPETVALPSTTKSEIIPTRPLKVEIPVNVDKPVTDKLDAIDTSDDAVRFL